MLKIKAIVFTVGYSSFRQRATMAALPEKWLVFKLFYTVFKPLLQLVVNLERILIQSFALMAAHNTGLIGAVPLQVHMCAFDAGVKL